MAPSDGQVSEIDATVIGASDRHNRQILDVYGQQSGRYAVYQTADRVVILYADDPLVQRIQRKRMVRLASLRNELDGWLTPWRAKPERRSRLWTTAREYDMRIAAALIEALEGDADTARAILADIKLDLAGERGSRARLSYLMWTAVSAVALLVLLAATLAIHLLLYNMFEWSDTVRAARVEIGRAIAMGIFGAVCSIALRIQGRGLDSDLRRLDSVTDSIVRIGIGAIAAWVLESFVLSGAIRLSFMQQIELPDTAGAGEGIFLPSWPVTLIVGFLAGFAERLVPDLLNSYAVKGRRREERVEAAEAAVAAPVKQPAADPVGDGDADLPESEDMFVLAPDADDQLDGCDVDLANPDQITDDAMLPPASGGVEPR